MNTVLLINSHIGADSTLLFNALDQNPRIQGFKINKNYSHPSVLEQITAFPHKLNNTAAIYMDELLHNHRFSCPLLYQECKFIYLIRPAKSSLNKIIEKGYSQKAAVRYYCYRLRRICEMAKRTPKAILLTWEDLITEKGFPLIEDYLNLKDPLRLGESEWVEAPDLIDPLLLGKAEDSYERHYYFLKNQNILMA